MPPFPTQRPRPHQPHDTPSPTAHVAAQERLAACRTCNRDACWSSMPPRAQSCAATQATAAALRRPFFLPPARELLAAPAAADDDAAPAAADDNAAPPAADDDAAAVAALASPAFEKAVHTASASCMTVLASACRYASTALATLEGSGAFQWITNTDLVRDSTSAVDAVRNAAACSGRSAYAKSIHLYSPSMMTRFVSRASPWMTPLL